MAVKYSVIALFGSLPYNWLILFKPTRICTVKTHLSSFCTYTCKIEAIQSSISSTNLQAPNLKRYYKCDDFRWLSKTLTTDPTIFLLAFSSDFSKLSPSTLLSTQTTELMSESPATSPSFCGSKWLSDFLFCFTAYTH